MNDETRTVVLNHLNKGHTVTAVDTSHIRNVAALDTHDLTTCSCNQWFGWVPKGVINV